MKVRILSEGGYGVPGIVGKEVEAIYADDTTANVYGFDLGLNPDILFHFTVGEFEIVDQSSVSFLLNSMKPGVVIALNIGPDEAELLWFEEASLAQQEDFEFIVERAPHGCNAVIEPWSGFLTTGGPDWVSYAIFGSLFAAFLFALYNKFSMWMVVS